MDREIRAILATITHPETGENLVDGGFVESINATEEKVTVALRFRKSRDPFAVKIKNRVEEILKNSYAKAATLGKSANVRVFDTVYAVGNPEASGFSATQGIISVRSENLELEGNYLILLANDKYDVFLAGSDQIWSPLDINFKGSIALLIFLK